MSERSAPPAELLRWRDRALSICDEADSMALAGFRRDIKVSTKPARTLVTEVELLIERMARSRLRSEFPGCGVVGEEEGTESVGGAISWHVDPIDATYNFVTPRLRLTAHSVPVPTRCSGYPHTARIAGLVSAAPTED